MGTKKELRIKINSNAYQSGWPTHYVASEGKHWFEHDQEVLTPHKHTRFTRWLNAGVEIRTPKPFHLLKCSGEVVSVTSQELPEPGYGYGYEAEMCQELKAMALVQGWVCDKTFGTVYQTGLPDFFCAHKDHGSFWLEVKTPTGKLEASQYAMFSRMESFGIPVYVITKVTDFPEVFKGPANWRLIEKKKWRIRIK